MLCSNLAQNAQNLLLGATSGSNPSTKHRSRTLTVRCKPRGPASRRSKTCPRPSTTGRAPASPPPTLSTSSTTPPTSGRAQVSAGSVPLSFLAGLAVPIFLLPRSRSLARAFSDCFARSLAR
eukprot:2960464-Rhodomonas_salina.3